MRTQSQIEFERRGNVLPGFLDKGILSGLTIADIERAERDLDEYHKIRVRVLARMREFVEATDHVDDTLKAAPGISDDVPGKVPA